GGWQWDIVYFPWGQIWQQTGTRQSAVWGDLDWQVNDPLHPSATREYSSNVNRWMTPDPGGRSVVKLDNPQTWNMYAYVGNNPTTLNDPGGLQSNCATGPDGGGCSSNGDSFEEDSMHFSDGRYGLDQITDLGIGMAKGLLNMLISTVNLEMAADPEMQGPQLPEFQATNATQGAGMVGAAVGLLFVPGAGEEAAAGESVSVYMKADESYVGISNSIARRQMEHGEELNGLVKLNSRTRARGVEQAIIEQRGLAKNGGTLANKINSIARSNPIYEQAVQFGREVLRSIGFPSF
ncbi:MAG TPA: RHS repeat-associated core domain-containing protein, partial [Terriglobia bacterium]|nr:RHS repeat-associated core domain-containing protein [Terriglobia bacterium]